MTPRRKHRRLVAWAITWAITWTVACLAALSSAQAHEVYWSLTDEEGHAGYLLGTIHSEDPRVLEFTPAFLDQLKGCEVYAMELVPDLPTMQRLLDTMQLPEGESLEALVGPERYVALSEALTRFGVPADQARRMKPWAAMMTLSLPPPKSGLFLDFALSLRAAGHGVQVVGLETLDEQLAFLEDLPLPRQLELLDQALAELDQVVVVHEAMVDSYLNDDLATLQQVADDQMGDLEPETRAWFQEEGIDARNRRMVARALPLLDDGCAFLAVGALHLPGEQGFLDLLRAEGYRLEEMPSPFLVNHAAD